MNLKLSKNKVNHLTTLIINFINNDDELDYNGDENQLRKIIFNSLMDSLRLFEEIDIKASEKATSHKNVIEGSREWEILYRKYSNEMIDKMGQL